MIRSVTFRRPRAGALNRTILALLGLVLLLAGLAGGLIAGGFWSVLTSRGLALPTPAGQDPIVPGSWGGIVQQLWFPWALIGAGLLVGILALAWLAAQRPQREEADTLRLSDELSSGLTTCSPGVLARAVEADVARLPGVLDSVAVVQGDARAPALALRVTLSAGAALREVQGMIETSVVDDLGTALGTAVRRLAVQFEVSSETPTSSSITV